MNKYKLSIILVLIAFMTICILSVSAQEKTKATYNWRMIATETDGDCMDVFADKFAEALEKKSNGQIKIEVFPYGTLGGERNIVELVKMGEIEFGSTGYGWLGGALPQAQIFALSYIWPRDVSAEVMHDVFTNGEAVKLLRQRYQEKGFYLLNLWNTGWQNITSKNPIRTPEDVLGVKHRVMGNPILVAAYNALGFDTTTFDYSEVYGALQTGLIDSQCNPVYCNYSMKFHEVTNYMTNIWNEPFVGTPVVSNVFFQSLPEDLQNMITETADELVVEMINWAANYNKECTAKIKAEKPSYVIYELTEEEIEPFKELANDPEKGSVATYLKTGGEGAQEILDALRSDIEAAMNK